MEQPIVVSVRMPPALHRAVVDLAAAELLSASALMRRLAQSELRRRGQLPAVKEAANA